MDWKQIEPSELLWPKGVGDETELDALAGKIITLETSRPGMSVVLAKR